MVTTTHTHTPFPGLQTYLLAQNLIFFLNLASPLALGVKVQDDWNWCLRLKKQPLVKWVKASQSPLT